MFRTRLDRYGVAVELGVCLIEMYYDVNGGIALRNKKTRKMGALLITSATMDPKSLKQCAGMLT